MNEHLISMNHLENDILQMIVQILTHKCNEHKRFIYFFFLKFSFLSESDRMEMEMYNSSSRSDSRRSSNDNQIPYTILTGPKNPNDLVDCQIILVNIRQRFEN